MITRSGALSVDVPPPAVDGDETTDQWESAPPNPAALIEALRSLGYSPGSALADLIDNSITAGSGRVDVHFHWSGSDSWCAIADDGRGMDEATLRQAMRFGSRDPLAMRDAGDLGRYGMGLKTASISQCRELTVVSRTRKGRPASARSWDIDHVREVGEWELRTKAPKAAIPILKRLDGGDRGTIVLWRCLGELVEPDATVDDEEAKRRFNERIASVEQHLSMVFGRYLGRDDAPLEIRLNGHRVNGWDPFLESNPATQPIATERLLLRGASVLVQGFVLPHRSKLTDAQFEGAAGPAGWNAQQGFYVYRQDRLIVAGDWLGLGYTRDDGHNLARISVDVPPALDRDWFLDVTKGTVRPPSALRTDLRRIAKVTRARASAVLHHRGADVGPRRKSSIVPVWRQRRRHGELVFGINRDHPIIAQLLGRPGDEGRELNAVLDLIEQTIPVPALPLKPAEAEHQRFDGRPPDAVIALAVMLYEADIARGLSRKQAAQHNLTDNENNICHRLILLRCRRSCYSLARWLFSCFISRRLTEWCLEL